MTFQTIVSLILTWALLVPSPVWSQEVSGPKTSLVQESGVLKIIVLQGEGALNSVKRKTATPPVVEVRDAQNKPVVGAEVVFQLPAAGPGGVFNGWMRTQTARTNEQGQAAATGMTPNDQEGRFNIKVTATEGTRTATAIIAQSNTMNGSGGPSAKSSRKGLWILLGVLGAAAGIGIGIAATRGGSSSGPAANPITIAPGPITVGAPR